MKYVFHFAWFVPKKARLSPDSDRKESLINYSQTQLKLDSFVGLFCKDRLIL